MLLGLCRRLRSAWEESVELQERMQLVNRPEHEELAHWAFDGRCWRLHGDVVPPDDGRRRSTTRGGWCPGLRTPAAPGT